MNLGLRFAKKFQMVKLEIKNSALKATLIISGRFFSKTVILGQFFVGAMILSNSLIVKAQSNAMIALAGAAFLVKDTFQDAQLENVAKQIEAVSVQLEILDVDGKFLTACGGTIVDSDKILTTSHCFFNVGKQDQKPFCSVRVSFTSDIVSELKNDKENLERYRQMIA